MKQRKFPVVPVTLLVILVGGAIVMSLKPLDAIPQQPDANDGIMGDSRSQTSAAELTKIAEKQSGKRKPMAAEIEDENAEPAILLPATFEYKPTPNPTSTAAQWYKGKPEAPN